ncbi:MAG: DUF624 domain-containing protein [Coprococcus sp.]|nr:DUF624 domain-containing protein [Coprococcus sp.]
MDKIFSTDNPLFTFLGRICDIFLLHLLWIITSIPIITIGASTTALYYTAMKSVKLEEGYIAKRFFKSFKENFKQATIIWLILLVVGAVFAFDLYFAIANSKKLLTLIFTVMTCVYLFVFFYVFPLQARFSNTIKATLKNALLLAVKNMPWTILIFAITFLFIYSQTLSAIFVFYMLFMGVGTYAYITAFIYNRIFEPYLPKERAIEDDRFLSEEKEKTTKKLVVTEEDEGENKISEDRKSDNENKIPENTKSDNESSDKSSSDIDTAPAPKKRLSIADKVNSVTAYEQANEEK